MKEYLYHKGTMLDQCIHRPGRYVSRLMHTVTGQLFNPFQLENILYALESRVIL